jgi:hypothetical protein
MTKLEALISFQNNRRRDTWAVYGAVEYSETQTEFDKDDIFLLHAPGTIWDECLFYCNEDLHLTLNGGVAEVQRLIINHDAVVDGTISIMLNSVSFMINVTASQTINDIANLIRATSFANWTVSGAMNEIIFTSNTVGRLFGAFQYNAGVTGVAGTIQSVTEGLNNSFINWNEYRFENQAKGTIMNNLNIIHPNIYCILTRDQMLAIVEPLDLSFIAFKGIDAVNIDDDNLNTILLEAGVPFITLEELEFSREEIIKLMIKPAIEEYYKWHPILVVEQYPVPVANINIPIPPYVKVVQRAYINPGYPITGNHRNPITRYFDEVILAASSRGSFANPAINYRKRQPYADIQAYSTFLLEKAVRQGAINVGSRKRIRVDMVNGRLTGYSNIQGILEVEWGACSYDWNDIPFNRQSEVREFATAKVLRALASLRMQANSNLAGTIDYAEFLNRAKELEEKVLTLWRESTKSVIVRG